MEEVARHHNTLHIRHMNSYTDSKYYYFEITLGLTVFDTTQCWGQVQEEPLKKHYYFRQLEPQCYIYIWRGPNYTSSLSLVDHMS